MWEWRVFYPVEEGEESTLDVWKLLKERHGRESVRSDVYVACSERAGVKVRGWRNLEVKLRRSREEENGAEVWSKVLHTPTRWDGKDVPKLLEEVTRRLAPLKQAGTDGDSELEHSYEDALSLSAPGHCSPVLVTLHKRISKHTIKGIRVEQTDLRVDGHPRKEWRTVCIKARMDDVKNLLQKRVGEGGETLQDVLMKGRRTPHGYPKFVLDLSHQK